MELRPYQIEALQRIYAAYESGVRRQLLAMATGAGKTVCFAALAAQRPGNVLVLAHRDRLIQQAAAKLSAVIPWAEMGVVKAEENRPRARVVVASVQTLARLRRLRQMPQFDTVIVDEAHRSAARTYRAILEYVCHDQTLLLGVTATPSRADGLGLDTVYEEIVYQIGILDLIQQGYLAPLRGQRITIDADFSKLHTKTNTDGINDYKADEVVDLMTKANWFEKTAEGWRKYAADRRTIAFVPRVAMAYRLAEHLREQGVLAAALDGSTPQHAQRQTLNDFERGKIQVLASCDLLTEGVDLPSANCILFARPTKSQIVYAQAIGRGTRLSPETGKTDCLVLDLVGASNRFDLCTLGDLVGVKELKDGETITEAKEREEKETDAALEMLPEYAEGEVVGREVDLFERRPQAQPEARKRSFEWEIYPDEKRALLRVSDSVFEIEKWIDVYAAYHHKPNNTLSLHHSPGAFRTYAEARDACEAEARQLLFNPDAPWMQKPATTKQLDLLRRLSIPFGDGITKAEASDLIDRRFGKTKGAAQAVAARG